MGIQDIFALIGGIALFLFGMNLMGEGLKKAAGSKLELILYRLTSTPIKGIFLGAAVTAVIQSSSATSVMVVGFVNSGMMKIKQAIGTIMGAIIGTSITGWIICLSAVSGNGIYEILSTDNLTAIIAVIGIVMLMFSKNESKKYISSIMLGFAVLMYGIATVTDAVYPLRESESFINMLTHFSNPLMGIFVGMLFTCVIQSASASVGILQALAVTGAINFGLALPIIMGIAIGASVPVLLSALGANVNGRRTAFIYLMVDFLGVLFSGIIFYTANAIFHFSFISMPMTMMSIALMNTVFRAAIVLMLTPLIGTMEKVVTKLIKDKEERIAELKDVEKLEERFLEYPVIAIEQTRTTMNTMSKLTRKNFEVAIGLFEDYSEKEFEKAKELEEVVDKYEDKIGNYIVKIMKNELDDNDNKKVSMFLHTINDFERMSDHSRNLAESAKEMHDKKIHFSEAANKEMKNLVKVVDEMIDTTIRAFIEDDNECIDRIAPLEDLIDDLCDEYKLHHVDRIQSKKCDYNHGFVLNDIITDLERIGDHCSNIGIALRMDRGDISERHGFKSKIEIEHEHNFEKYYNEYLEKFKIS